jgi:23S rRNA-/tRNA-specific pseudouridylate synthase
VSNQPRVEKFFITAKTAIPLKQLLAAHLPDRYDAETVITSGGVWKNKLRILKPSTIIQPRETLKIHTSPFQGKTYVLDPKHVIFENNDLLVVYKPCDLNVHAVPSSCIYHLAYGVNAYLKQRGIHFESTPVTRLDRPVEGLVIFPKKKSMERKLFQLIKERRIQKWYTAAIEKYDSPKYQRIQDIISTDGKRTHLDKNGKKAHSLFVKTESLVNVDLYSVFIFTGRRHQIRFHASHYMKPIIGDRLYGSSELLGPDEIALMCRGYNIPYRREVLRIRLSSYYITSFRKKLSLSSSK